MSIKQYLDSKLAAFSYNLSEFFNIRIVVLTLLRLNTFPGNMKPNVIESPVFQVIQVDISERIVSVKCLGIGVEGESLVNCIDTMKDRSTIVLVDKKG